MILVDFDHTLAHYESWEKNGASLGEPVPLMLERAKYWLAMGKDVRIFTARAAKDNPRRDGDMAAIKEWCMRHLGVALPVQNWKDFTTEAIWDDLAYSVEANTGRLVRRLDLDLDAEARASAR
jgi:hypothetical protein